MTTLFDRYALSGHTLPNRIVMAPMTRGRATPDGLPTASTAIYYAQRATAGLIVSEGVQPSLQGQSNPNTPGLHDAAQVAAWRPVTDAVHANGGRIVAQLMHGGRVGHQDVVGFQPVAPSAVALGADVFTGAKGKQPAPVPRALSTAEVRGEVAVYAEAARNAVAAGFDGIELHGANGYLIQQFLSSNANLRTDGYGGSITGRIRFAVEVAEAVADAIGPDRVGIRLSPAGEIWNVQESDVAELYAALYRELARLNIAYVHTLNSAPPEITADLRKIWPNAYIMNPSAGIVGPQADRERGEYWLAQGMDLISYGRAFLNNPDLVERLRLDVPLREADPATYYEGGDRGYIDAASLQH